MSAGAQSSSEVKLMSAGPVIRGNTVLFKRDAYSTSNNIHKSNLETSLQSLLVILHQRLLHHLQIQ